MYRWLQRLVAGAPVTHGREDDAAREFEMMRAHHPAMHEENAAPVPFDLLDLGLREWHAALFDCPGDGSLEMNAAECEALQAVEAIASAQSCASLVRRLPGLIPQILQSLRSDNFSGAQLSRTISSDVVLVAEVTRLANCALKGSGKQVSSVGHAVLMIGQEGLRHLIMGVAFRPIIDMKSGPYTRKLAPRIWELAERCANANRRLAEDALVPPFDAFLAGLVQDVGMIVALRAIDRVAIDRVALDRVAIDRVALDRVAIDRVAIERTSGGEQRLGSEMFCMQLASAARRLSCRISREWHFPEAVVQALSEQESVAPRGALSPLGRMVSLSSHLGRVCMLAEGGAVPDDLLDFTRLPAAAAECREALAQAS